MKKFHPIQTGHIFGHWEALRKSELRFGYWICKCICGTIRPVSNRSLNSGSSRSCGCKRMEEWDGHGYVGTRIYNTYHNMIGRCYRKSTIGYHRYGGRGIRVCPEWRISFLSFLSDMGECPSSKHSIERIN